jgi:serine/threonine protein kinase
MDKMCRDKVIFPVGVCKAARAIVFKYAGRSLDGKQFTNPCQLRAFLEQTLKTLKCLHSQNYVHGDIKPANIALDDFGDKEHRHAHIHILDYGISQHFDGVIPEAFMLYEQGTPEYIPAEAFLQFSLKRQVKQRAKSEKKRGRDIFALGITAIELILGEVSRELRAAEFGFKFSDIGYDNGFFGNVGRKLNADLESLSNLAIWPKDLGAKFTEFFGDRDNDVLLGNLVLSMLSPAGLRPSADQLLEETKRTRPIKSLVAEDEDDDDLNPHRCLTIWALGGSFHRPHEVGALPQEYPLHSKPLGRPPLLRVTTF